jgi:hypothetical protein
MVHPTFNVDDLFHLKDAEILILLDTICGSTYLGNPQAMLKLRYSTTRKKTVFLNSVHSREVLDVAITLLTLGKPSKEVCYLSRKFGKAIPTFKRSTHDSARAGQHLYYF